MDRNQIHIKSLENFQEKAYVIHIIFFRYTTNASLEFFLQKTSNNLFSNYSGFVQKNDLNNIFCAARILFKILKNKDFILDLKEQKNWADPYFQKLLGVVSDCYDFHDSEYARETIFFIEEKTIKDILKDFFDSEWISYNEINSIDSTLPLFTSEFLKIFTSFDIKNYLKYEQPKFYGILNCETNPLWENIYEGLYQGYFQKPHEKWVSFKIGEGTLPKIGDILKFNGWVITGSGFSTYDENLLWLKDFFKFLNEILKIKGDEARILGICFGHQALAKALGGETEKMGEKLMIKQKIYFNQNFLEKDYVTKSKVDRTLLKNGILLNQSHGDQVSKLPPNAEILAYIYIFMILFFNSNF